MALESRIRELDTRHRDLDMAIDMETRRPSSDPMQISALKRQKLKIKEQIEALRQRKQH